MLFAIVVSLSFRILAIRARFLIQVNNRLGVGIFVVAMVTKG
jgi:hypothetical protein